MQLNTLQDTSVKDIANVFSKAFENYIVDMRQTEDEMLLKFRTESIDLSLSVGTFDSGALVGFILFGVDNVNGVKTMWDGGTGVLAGYRGQKLTKRMFEYILPMALNAGVQQVQLEVMEDNTTAYNIYEQIGFKKVRKMHAYKGSPKVKSTKNHIPEETKDYDPEALFKMGGWQPAWQQMNRRIRNTPDVITTIVIKEKDTPIAYAHYNKAKKRVVQFAVANAHRRKELGTALFNHMANDMDILSVVNVDEHSTDAIAFLESIGMNYLLSQYEMIMHL